MLPIKIYNLQNFEFYIQHYVETHAEALGEHVWKIKILFSF